MHDWIRRFVRDSRAVAALEYAILVGVIAVAIAAALTAFSGNITTALTNIGANVALTESSAPDANPAGSAN